MSSQLIENSIKYNIIQHNSQCLQCSKHIFSNSRSDRSLRSANKRNPFASAGQISPNVLLGLAMGSESKETSSPIEAPAEEAGIEAHPRVTRRARVCVPDDEVVTQGQAWVDPRVGDARLAEFGFGFGDFVGAEFVGPEECLLRLPRRRGRSRTREADGYEGQEGKPRSSW